MRNFKFWNKKYILLMVIDALLVVLCEYLALAVRFDFKGIPDNFFNNMISYVGFDIVIMLVVFIWIGLYNRVLALMTFQDLIDISFSVGIGVAVITGYHVILQIGMPRSFYLITLVLYAVLTILSRLCVKYYFNARGTLNRRKQGRKVMLIGAGSGADMFLREIENDDSFNYNVVAIIDDDPRKWSQKLRHVRIHGGRDKIKEIATSFEVEEIIIAIPSLSNEDRTELVRICNETGCVVKILPEIAKTLTGQIKSSIRDVNIQDLIGRKPITIDQDEVNNFIKGKRVLVTGGGGSIGSELCRQIMAAKPDKLIIFDIYENNAYAIQQELVRGYGWDNIEVLIGSVRDKKRLEDVFDTYRPQVVFHAAAHKHVPLMEDSPCEAVKNNCMGTFNAAELADKYLVDNFVLISTDKAVRPTNVMGATKRICEMIITHFAKVSIHTRYSAVRFGNVLGSNGSVVPLFLEQIEKGGPVTVTHRDITRFFMTIPEAVSLVLQASLYAKGGDIFVLDMGQPVKIYELAENLIRLKGLVPGKDIKIEITGLRPGEKLYEEILMDEEGLMKTANDLIFIGKPMKICDDMVDKLMELETMAEDNVNTEAMKEAVARVCGTYKVAKQLVG